MDKYERQRQIESDSVRDGCVRWCQNTEYLEAADTKPYRKLIGISLMALAAAIRDTQDSLAQRDAKEAVGAGFRRSRACQRHFCGKMALSRHATG